MLLCVINSIRIEHRSDQRGRPCVVPPATGCRAVYDNSAPARPDPTGPASRPARRAGPSSPAAPIRESAICPRRRLKGRALIARFRLPADATASAQEMHVPGILTGILTGILIGGLNARTPSLPRPPPEAGRREARAAFSAAPSGHRGVGQARAVCPATLSSWPPVEAVQARDLPGQLPGLPMP
jgi:hypothetical protein